MNLKNSIIFLILLIVPLVCKKSSSTNAHETHMQLAERISSYIIKKDLTHLDEILAISAAEISNYSIVREAEEEYLKLFNPGQVHERLEALKLEHQNQIYFMLKDEKSMFKFIEYCNGLDAAQPLEKAQCYANTRHLWPKVSVAWVRTPTIIEVSGVPIKIGRYSIVLKGRGRPSGDLVIQRGKNLNVNNLQLSETNIREEFLYQNGHISPAMAYECCMITEKSLESCEGGGENVLWEYGANSPDFRAQDW